ncbi:hypothetical protein [Thermococcus prieurii]
MDKKVLLATLLLLIPISFQFTDRPFTWRLAAVVLVLLLSSLLFWRKLKKGERRVSLSAFVHAYFINLIIGNVKSLFGIFVFILLAAVLTQWLPDAIESGSPYWAGWNLAYLLSILLLTYWVAVPEERKEEGLRKTKYLVFALSWPSWSPSSVAGANCNELFTNSPSLAGGGGKPPNVTPLFVAVKYHLERLERVYLLVSSSEMKYGFKNEDEREYVRTYLTSRGISPEGHDFRDLVRLLLVKLSECTGKGITVEWTDGTIEGLTGNDVTFKLAVADDFDDVDKCREVIRSLTDEIIKRESEELTFDLTGGKTLVSVAMALTAIRRDCQAEYLRQNVYGKEPEELLKKVNLDIFTVEDILEELRDAFEAG